MRSLPSSAALVAAVHLVLGGRLSAGDPPVVVPAPGTPPKVELKEVDRPVVAGKKLRVEGSGPAVLTPGHFRVYYLTNVAGATDLQWSVRELDLPDADLGKGKIVLTKVLPEKTQLFGRYEGEDLEDFHEYKDATGNMFGVYVAQALDDKGNHVYGSGRVEVVATVVIDGKLQVVRQRIDANLGALPPPIHDDGGVKPRPPVPAGKRQIVIVEETEAAAANRAALFADKDLVARIASQGHVWRCVDQNVKQYDPQTKTQITPPELATYLADAKTKTLPVIYISVPGNPKPLYTGTIQPGTLPATLLKLITDNGG